MPRTRRGHDKLQPETLGGLLAKGLDVWAWCPACCHNAVLASAGLAARLGVSFAVPDVAKRLRCTRCNGREAEARPDWPKSAS